MIVLGWLYFVITLTYIVIVKWKCEACLPVAQAVRVRLIYLGAVVAGKPKKRKHNTWVREIFRKREEYGTLNLVREAAMADDDALWIYAHEPTQF